MIGSFPVCLFRMLIQILQKLRRPGPVSDSPVFKVPLIHVVVAFVIHIPDQAVPDHKIRREIINIQPGGFGLRRHIPYLIQIRISRTVLPYQVEDRIPGDIFLYHDLSFFVDGNQGRNPDPCFLQPLIIPFFCFDLISKGVLIAGLMMDLLDNNRSGFCLRQIRIPAFSMSEQPYDAVFFSAGYDCFHFE